jgi:hypothetical protein
VLSWMERRREVYRSMGLGCWIWLMRMGCVVLGEALVIAVIELKLAS